MKKLINKITITFTAVLLIAISILNSAAVSYFKTDGFTYYLTENSFAVITDYDNRSSSVTIPKSLAGSYVVGIEDYTFLNNTFITEVSFDEAKYLSDIGISAFEGCTSLTSVSIPFSIDSLSKKAFQNCTSLKDLTISNGITEIPVQAFYGCISLNNVAIPQSVTSIANFAFSDCTSLTSITIPKATTSIASNAFRNCSNLTIYGYKNSYAQQYATENSIPFVIIPEYELGDVDLSGRVDIKDATLIQRYVASLAKLTDEQEAVADVNQDGVVNVADATFIQRALVEG